MSRFTSAIGVMGRQAAAWWTGLALAAALVAAGACGGGAPDEEEIQPAEVPTITAEVGTVVRRDLTRTVDARGVVVTVPNEDAKVSALVPGRVVAMRAAEGDRVSKGQVVAEIDPRPFDDARQQAAAALDEAKATAENARLNLERTQRLFERGIAAGKEVEDARTTAAAAAAAVAQATAALSTAEWQLAHTKIASPIAGRIVKRFVAVGEQVEATASQPVFEVANLARVELAANLPAEYLAEVKPGQAAHVSSDAYRDRTFDGTVLAIAPAVDPATNAALVRIRLENAGERLMVGMFGRARIDVEARPGALVVPPSAVVRDEHGAAVYVVTGDQAVRTQVETGLDLADAVEILSGVTEGQRVLVTSTYGLGEKARLAGHS